MFAFTNIVVLSLVVYFIIKETGYSKVRPTGKKSPEEHYGVAGEQEVVDTMKKSLGTYKVLKNLYLPHPFEKGETTEIDMLLIHNKGIVVVESKNWSGEVTGNDQDKHWYADSTGDKGLYNPLKQNAFHELALRKLIPSGYCDKMSSIVVFGTRSNISSLNLKPENKKKIVHQNKLDSFMFKLMTSKNEKFTSLDMKLLVDQLTPFAHAEKKTKKRHVDRIQNKYGE